MKPSNLHFKLTVTIKTMHTSTSCPVVRTSLVLVWFVLLHCVFTVDARNELQNTNPVRLAFVSNKNKKNLHSMSKCVHLKPFQHSQHSSWSFCQQEFSKPEFRDVHVISGSKDCSYVPKAFYSMKKNSVIDELKSWVNSLLSSLSSSFSPTIHVKPPPMQIDDPSLLFYDVFLILNLSVSISFWVVHRLSILDIIPALSEGSLLCILWILAGLWNGAFLYSAVDGHYDPRQEGNEGKGGPAYAALLGLSTFVTTANMRVILALLTAIVEHRRVGDTHGEDLIPLEIAFGLILMSAWRLLHSTYTTRI